jgi:hypothetical protein
LALGALESPAPSWHGHDGELDLSALRAARDDHGRSGRRLAGEGHPHAECDAQGDADPGSRRLFYYATGAIVLGIEQSPAGGNEAQNPASNVPLGTKWSYVIGLSGNNITLVIDGSATQTFTTSSTFNQENMYFKAGDYDQSVGSGATVGAKVQFYGQRVVHGP